MSEAKLEMTRLESWLKNPLLGGTSASRNDLFGSSAGGGGSSSSSSGGRQPRRFGPEETDETRKYDNDGLLQLAKQTIDVQDKSLDRLLQSVQRTKHVALAIGDELGTRPRGRVSVADVLCSVAERDAGGLERKGGGYAGQVEAYRKKAYQNNVIVGARAS